MDDCECSQTGRLWLEDFVWSGPSGLWLGDSVLSGLEECVEWDWKTMAGRQWWEDHVHFQTGAPWLKVHFLSAAEGLGGVGLEDND